MTGRLRVRITVGGVSYFPEDIEELVASSHDALRPGSGAAFTIPLAGEEALVVAHEIDEGHAGAIAPKAATGAIRAVLEEGLGIRLHDVVLLRAGTLPRSPTGKVRRSSCRQRYLDGSLEPLAEHATHPRA